MLLLQVTSRKDQEQYWFDRNKPYRYMSVPEFAERFKSFHVGMSLDNELSLPFDKSQGHKAALVFTKYSVPKIELLKACWDRQVILLKRNAIIYIFKMVQIIIMAIIGSTVYLRSEMHTRNEEDGAVYVGSLLYAMFTNLFNSYAELPLIITRLPVFYKQRDLLFHPAWTFTLPNFLLNLPISIMESVLWVSITYYTIGYAPEVSRYRKSF